MPGREGYEIERVPSQSGFSQTAHNTLRFGSDWVGFLRDIPVKLSHLRALLTPDSNARSKPRCLLCSERLSLCALKNCMRVLAPIADHADRRRLTKNAASENSDDHVVPKQLHPLQTTWTQETPRTSLDIPNAACCIKAGAFPKSPSRQAQRQTRSLCSPASNPCRCSSGIWPSRSKSCTAVG